MNVIRSLGCIVAMTLAGIVWSCGSDSNDDTTSVSFVLSATTLHFGPSGGTETLTASTATALRFDTHQPWLEATATAPVTDRSLSIVSVTATANSDTTARQATLTVRSGDESIDINVTQDGAVPPAVAATSKAKAIAARMYPGWNLGNTLEAGSDANLFTNRGGVATETAWQGTKTTQAIIDLVKASGFKAVRIPTAWVMGHIVDSDNMTIDDEWIGRVREIIDYCMKADLYVIINDHWDGGWLENSFGDVSDVTVALKSAQLGKLWTNIATALGDYDDRLLFAGLNEPGMHGDNFNATMTTALLHYEQTFIDAVRATGGNNAQRVLVVQGPFTDIAQTCSSTNGYTLDRLTDSAEGALMVEVHYYTPYQFCLMTEDASWGRVSYYWGADNASGDATHYYSWGGKSGEDEAASMLGQMYESFYKKGYPVVLGECGAYYRMADDARHAASVRSWYRAVARNAVANGCIPFFWDINVTSLPNITIFDRSKVSIFNRYMLDGIQEGVSNATWPD